MYHFIVNPASKSGRGQKIWDRLLPVIEQRAIDYDVYFTRPGHDTASYVSHLEHVSKDYLNLFPDALTNGVIRLIVLGGDGTVNEVIQGITDCALTWLSYIPTGSSNDLARDLGGRRTPEEQLVYILEHPKAHVMDLGRVHFRRSREQGFDSRYFAVSSGVGFDATVCREALVSPVKDFLNRIGLGKLTYTEIAIRQLFLHRAVSCDLFLDDSPAIHLDNFLFVVCMIHRYEGGGFQFCPHADACDGALDLCVVGRIPKWKVLLMLPSAFWGRHTLFHNVDNYRARKVRICTSTPLWFHTDVEVSVRTDELYFTCEAKRIRFFGI